MRLYEVVYILDASLEESAATEKLEKFHALAIAHDEDVANVAIWRRDLHQHLAIRGARIGVGLLKC